MMIAVPLVEGRVAPRCTRATHLLLVTVSRGRVTSRNVLETPVDGVITLVELLRRHGVATLVCGGISPDSRSQIRAEGIDIVENVACSAAEVVSSIDMGDLRRGLGFDGKARERVQRLHAIRTALEQYSTGPHEPEIDCLACEDRVCLVGLPCPGASAAQEPGIDDATRRIMAAATDITLDQDPKLCRVTELVYLCLEMEYRRIGIAFCADLLEPARILAGVLRRFFDVVPVCCKIAGEGSPIVASGPEARRPDADGWACNPLLQASVLNHSDTDLNVLVGLCIGADAVLSKASRAPVTALFVKDRSLANNPIGAVYSEYYLHESIALPRTHRTSRNQGLTLQQRGSTSPEREEP
jgi:uncharacterized metal-binding protein/predicted Fe-Mo cluster-binding NifX family protein